MARRRPHTPNTPNAPSPGLAVAAGCVLFLVQVIKISRSWNLSSLSPYRLPKEALALGGLALIVSLGIAIALRKGQVSLPRGPVTIVLAAYPLLLLISTLWSAQPMAAALAAGSATVWILAIVWMSTLEPVHRDRLTVWCAAGAAITAAFMLLQLAGVSWALLPGYDPHDRLRLVGLTGNSADLAAAVLLVLALLVPLEQRSWRQWWRWLLIGVLAAAALGSQTLTGYAALLALAMVWVVALRSKRVLVIAGCVLAAAAAVALVAGPRERAEQLVHRLTEGDWYSLLSARHDGWTAATQMIRTHPLLGVGAAQFTCTYYPSRVAWLEEHHEVGSRGELATHFEWAHCDPLQTIAELGALGWLWLLALMVALWRSRNPRLLLVGAAFAPFAALHYPTHLAVGLLPLVLVLAGVLANEAKHELVLTRKTATVIATALVGASIVVVWWQARRLAFDHWAGTMEGYIKSAAGHPAGAKIAAAVERSALARIDRDPEAEAWLWRLVGRARILRGDPAGAEEALRRSFALWPHEDAELWLGIALARGGKRAEAIRHLAQVCMTNPTLLRFVEDQDPDLARTVHDLIQARSQRD
jgi:O-antigen ligase